MDKIFDYTEGKEAINPKEKPEKLRAFMQACLPDYDKDRVYNSDLKKLFQWYNLLLNAGLLVKEENKENETVEAETETTNENSQEK